METFKSKKDELKRASRIWTVAGVATLTITVSLALGHAVSRDLSVQGASSSEATPTTLTASEPDELNRLGTAVARPTVSVDGTPASEPNPVASPEAVEPLAPGTAVSTKNGWTVTVSGVSLPTPDDRIIPEGRFLQVEMTVTNNNNSSQVFEFTKWLLVDDHGNVYRMHHGATTLVSGSRHYRGVFPGEDLTVLILYDVSKDSGSSFTFVDSDEPTIQYALTLQVFG